MREQKSQLLQQCHVQQCHAALRTATDRMRNFPHCSQWVNQYRRVKRLTCHGKYRGTILVYGIAPNEQAKGSFDFRREAPHYDYIARLKGVDGVTSAR